MFFRKKGPGSEGDGGGVAVAERPDDFHSDPEVSDYGVAVADDEPSVPAVKVKAKKAKKPKAPKEIELPSTSILAGVRRVHNDCIEDYSGSSYAVWQVAGMDILEDQCINGWSAMLNSLEYPVQVIIRQHTPDYSDIRTKLYDERPEAMRVGWIEGVGNSMLEYLEHLEDRGQRFVSRSWYVVASVGREAEIQSILQQSGFSAERMQDAALELLLAACVSGMGFGHVQDMYQVSEERNYIELNQRFASVYEVNRWPRAVTVTFFEHLLRLGEEMDISFWLWPVSPRESHSRLQMQRSRFEGARIAAEQKGKLVDQEVELAISDIVRISEGVSRGVTRLYRRTCTIAVFGRDRQHLAEVHDKVTGHFRASLSSLRLLKLRQGKAFAAVMPALRRGLGEADLTDTETLLRLFPFSPRDMDTREGTLLGMDLRSRTAVFIDPFSPNALNGHMVVMARSGAGKSFFTKLRVLREAQRGIPVYLIDPEGEYGIITETLGGEVFIPGSPGYGLNPFVVRYTGAGDLTRRIASLCSLVAVMLEGNVDQDLKAIIDRCVSGFFAKELREKGRGSPLGAGGMTDFDLYLHTEEAADAGGKRLAHLLSPFSTGSARYLMKGDARDLLADEKPVTSFNLKNLPSRLKPVATSICAEVVWGLAVTDPRPRILVVDECWTVLSTPSGAEALLTIVKRARKYQLGLTTITQDIQDFLAEDSGAGLIAGHAGRALLQNSAMKLALQQDPAALHLVAGALGLSEDATGFLAGCMRGQGLLVGPYGDCYPIDIVSTAEERDVVLDRLWMQQGEEKPEIEEDYDIEEDDEELGDRLVSMLEAERVADG